jgi:hypothetical protein
MKELAICLQAGDKKSNNWYSRSGKIQNTTYGTGNSFASRGTKKGIDKMAPEMAVTRPRKLIKKLKQGEESKMDCGCRRPDLATVLQELKQKIGTKRHRMIRQLRYAYCQAHGRQNGVGNQSKQDLCSYF